MKHWPGLFCWLGEGLLRVVGYSLFVGAGYAVAIRQNIVLIILLIALGHCWVVVAEIVNLGAIRRRNAKER